MRPASCSKIIVSLLFISACFFHMNGYGDEEEEFSLLISGHDAELPISSIRFEQESLVDNLAGKDGFAIAENIHFRRQQQGADFVMPELKHVVANMKHQLRAIKLLDACKDKDAVDDMIARLRQDAKMDFPYKRTITDLFKANLIVDLVKSRQFDIYPDGFAAQCSYPNSITFNMSTGVRNQDPYIHGMWTYSYPVSYTEHTLSTLDLTSKPVPEQTLSVFTCLKLGTFEPSPVEIFLKLVDREDIVLLPTFHNLSQDFFVETAPFRIYPLGLTRGYAVNDNNVYSTKGYFFSHDVYHTKAIVEHNGSSNGCTEDFLRTCDENGKCYRDSRELGNQVVETLYRTIKNADWLPYAHKAALMPPLTSLLFYLTHEQSQQGCSPLALSFLTVERCRQAVDQINAKTLAKTPFESDPIYTKRAIAWIVQAGEYLRMTELQDIEEGDLCRIYQGIDNDVPSFWRNTSVEGGSRIHCPE